MTRGIFDPQFGTHELVVKHEFRCSCADGSFTERVKRAVPDFKCLPYAIDERVLSLCEVEKDDPFATMQEAIDLGFQICVGPEGDRTRAGCHALGLTPPYGYAHVRALRHNASEPARLLRCAECHVLVWFAKRLYDEGPIDPFA